MIDYEAPEADALEQEELVADDSVAEGGALVDLEAPEADAAEQHAPAAPGGGSVDVVLPYDVDEADAADQSRVVELDEDDYR